MFNKVVLVGNLTRDIEMRYGQNGNAIGACAIAVTRRFSVNGEKREETCFIDIAFFGRTAEVANQYLSKGSKVLIEGRLRFEQWVDQNGQNRSKHSIGVENMEMLGTNPQSANFNTNASNMNSNYSNQSYDPYMSENRISRKEAPSPPKSTPVQNQEKVKEIDIDAYDNDDTDLPF